jgi:hypothetical protein
VAPSRARSSRAAGDNVGQYAINAGDLAAAANYSLTVGTGVTFAITASR